MLLTSFFVGSMLTTFGSTEFTKTQHFSLDKDTKEKILNEGLYHFTSQENANRIAKEGYFLPSNFKNKLSQIRRNKTSSNAV